CHTVGMGRGSPGSSRASLDLCRPTLYRCPMSKLSYAATGWISGSRGFLRHLRFRRDGQGYRAGWAVIAEERCQRRSTGRNDRGAYDSGSTALLASFQEPNSKNQEPKSKIPFGGSLFGIWFLEFGSLVGDTMDACVSRSWVIIPMGCKWRKP